jgi:release factor glutamine methyltransferase
LAEATGRLAAAGVATPRVDAELLLAHVLDVPRSRLLTVGAPPAAGSAFAVAVDRRVAGEPLQWITGTAPFRQLEIPVGPGVFIPRPETELLVDAVLPVLRSAPDPFAVDLCSGSGALALALADEVAGIRVTAVEQPGPAFDEWLTRNLSGTRVEVVAADVANPSLLATVRGRVDAIVSNPPYVPDSAQVASEVRHDPATAVFAGADGLAVIPHVIARAGELLRPGGVLAMEHDDTQRGAVSELLVADGRWIEVVDHDDLAGRPRYVTAVRR